MQDRMKRRMMWWCALVALTALLLTASVLCLRMAHTPRTWHLGTRDYWTAGAGVLGGIGLAGCAVAVAVAAITLVETIRRP